MADLSNLFQSDPAAQELGLQQFGLDQQINQARLAGTLQEQQQSAAMFPSKLQQQDIQNQQGLAQIPGMKATSSLNEDKASLSRQTMGKQVESLLKEYEGKISKEDLDSLTRQGQKYSQAGLLVRDMPGVISHARAKEILGSDYLPEFDKVPPEALGGVLHYIGSNMNEAAVKFQLQQAGLAQKGATAENVADINNRGKVEAAKIAAAAKTAQYSKEFIELKAKFGNYPQQAAFYHSKALEVTQAAGDVTEPEQKAALREMADVYSKMAAAAQQQEIQKAVAAAQETNRSKPDLNTFGIPTVTAPGGNNPTVAPSTGSPAQQRGMRTGKQMDPAAYQGWFNAAKAANPGMSDAAIEAEAIKRGYK